jgi:hypothetical protein
VSLTAFCINLLSRTADPATHFYAIDDKFSEMFLCQYRASELDPPISEDLTVHRSVQLLTRLPSVAPKIDFTYHVWGNAPGLDGLKRYCASNIEGNEGNPADRISPWSELRVVSGASIITLRLALLITTSGDDHTVLYQPYEVLSTWSLSS